MKKSPFEQLWFIGFLEAGLILGSIGGFETIIRIITGANILVLLSLMPFSQENKNDKLD